MTAHRNKHLSPYIYVLVTLFLITTLVLILSQKILLPWSYYVISISVGIVLAIMIWRPSKSKWHIYLSIVMLAVLLWNIFAIATSFSVIPFYDSYNDYSFSRFLLENGHFQVPMFHRYLTDEYTSISDPSTYPLFAILTVAIVSITGVDLLHATFLMTSLNGLATMLFVFLFSKALLEKSSLKDKALPIALLIFAVSPDMIYNGMQFYHRDYSLGLCFMMLYLLQRCARVRPQKNLVIVFLFSLLILPLSYGYYPSVYIVFLFWFTLLTYIYRTFSNRKRAGVLLKLSYVPFLLIFIMGFLWVFSITYPNTLVNTFSSYVQSLLHPKMKIVELERVATKAYPSIPRSLTPEPLIYFLQARFLLILLPMLIAAFASIYRLLKKKENEKHEILFPLFCTLAFIPLIVLDFIAGYWESLEFRFYAMPLIVFYTSTIYATLLHNKRRVTKATVSILMGFLVFLAFLAPFSNLYFARQIYDPSIKFRDVGAADPTYIRLKSFLEEHPLGNGTYLSDFPQLLLVVMQMEDYKSIRMLSYYNYTHSNVYFIEFIKFNPTLGYHSPEAIAFLREIKSRVPLEYNLILDSGYYSIYLREMS